jgi:hypothetical protein
MRVMKAGDTSPGQPAVTLVDGAASWGLIRLVLRRGNPELESITFDEVEEMRLAIKDAASIPGIHDAIDPALLAKTRQTWGTKAYRTGVVLLTGLVENVGRCSG